MPSPSLVILYVDAPRASAAFYGPLLERDPDELSDTFALFRLPCGTALGLWSRHTVEPAPAAPAGAGAIAVMVEDVDATHAAWAARGLPMVQQPVDLDFGRTFVALDPDGHRLRVYRPTT